MECCPKAVIGAVASQMGGSLLCLGGFNNVHCCVSVELTMLGSKNGQQGTLCIRKYRCDYVFPPLPPFFGGGYESPCHLPVRFDVA